MSITRCVPVILLFGVVSCDGAKGRQKVGPPPPSAVVPGPAPALVNNELSALLPSEVDGYRPDGADGHYGPDTLFDLINGAPRCSWHSTSVRR